jgi:hypothetical protein
MVDLSSTAALPSGSILMLHEPKARCLDMTILPATKVLFQDWTYEYPHRGKVGNGFADKRFSLQSSRSNE